jgi:hypothetical protein
VLFQAAFAVEVAIQVWPMWSGLRLAQGAAPYHPMSGLLSEVFWVLLAYAGLVEAASLYAAFLGATATFGLWASTRLGAYASLLLSG